MFYIDSKNFTYSWAQVPMNRTAHCVRKKSHWLVLSYTETGGKQNAFMQLRTAQGADVLPEWKHEWPQWMSLLVYFPQEGYYQHKYKTWSVLVCWLNVEWESCCYWVSRSTTHWDACILVSLIQSNPAFLHIQDTSAASCNTASSVTS